MDIARLAGEAYGHFERAERPDGESFYRLKDDAPEWLHELVRDAHGEFLPDDWRYASIHAALGAIHDSDGDEDGAHEFADGNVDTYNGERLAWLGSHLSRPGYCDAAAEEFGSASQESDIIEQIGWGQYEESREVFESVWQSLEDHADEDDYTGPCRFLSAVSGLAARNRQPNRRERPMTPTLATRANMRRFADANPSRKIETEDGPATLMGRTCFAYSPLTGEEASASAGDYWQLPEDKPLTDSEGEPMVLAITRTLFLDALTEEQF